MSDLDLLFLATSRVPDHTGRVDKYLDGYYTMQFMSEGAIDLSYDDRHYVLEGSWYYPIYPGPRSTFFRVPGHGPWFHRHVGFSGARVFDWIADGLWPTEPQPAPPGYGDGVFFDRLIAEVVRGDIWGRRLALNLLEELLIVLAQARAASVVSSKPALEPWLQRVVDKITSGGELDYDTIAAAEGMSASTLRRHFRLAMGLSIHQYVIRRRVESARQLLLDTDLPLKAIADIVGYENQYFFSRQFREVMRVAPGLFRRSRL
ncbi:MAG TPA: AraC family transcriptional regulator [Capsulimonadaceae bacterium]|jgi:AraC-like DNA-binding protein